MIEHLKGKENVMKFSLFSIALFGLYLIVSWVSYSPLDNGWTIASSATIDTLNKAGELGAWIIDVLLAMFGKVAFMLPFGLTFSAIYVLLLGKVKSLRWYQMLLWGSSFFIFMWGIAGLATILLPNSPYYLSGGFIGGMLHTWLDGVGLFGTLVVAMLLTAVGFYFCSGQVLIPLFNRFYEWVTEIKEEQYSTTSSELQKHQANVPLEDSSFIKENSDQRSSTIEKGILPQDITDVSRFTRPKIIGLKDVSPPSALDKTTKPSLVDLESFPPVNNSPLPKVNISTHSDSINGINETRPVMSTSTLFPRSNESVEQIENAMPKVRLNSQMQAVTEKGEVSSHLQKIEVNEPLVVSHITETSPIIEENRAVEILPQSDVPAFIERSVNSTIPQYPKGYGESLIHPLLQPKTTIQKPTTPMPTLDLLNETPKSTQQLTEQEIRETSVHLEQELANFGIKATVEDVLVGPVVTRYEIQPAAGVKVAKIASVASDLARALIFKAIRVTDSVPGKPYIGIEAPNPHRETVWLRDVLDSDAFRHTNAVLPMALGSDISGDPVVVDMAKMPHLLVAGQTGGGKSVGINTMILSLLFKLTPDQVRFIMIDPKMVELSNYNDIPHLLTPVVTDMKQAENALRWAVEEMERRYQLLTLVKVRNIAGYNAIIQQADEMGMPIPNTLWRPGDSMDTMPPPLEKMSYIVLVVDEFADLMMSTGAGKQVEDHIMRIAQKARAVGIHLILATQRPSADVITGVIKANIPSRIAFTVASQIDSRTILDKGGAESLLNHGDMLYSPNESPELIRVHGAFMTDEEVNRVTDDWRARGKPKYIHSITVRPEEEETQTTSRESLDPLFDEVVQYLVDGGLISISGIQRRFSIGFNRAARIVEQLEQQGILSVPDHRGKRELLAR